MKNGATSVAPFPSRRKRRRPQTKEKQQSNSNRESLKKRPACAGLQPANRVRTVAVLLARGLARRRIRRLALRGAERGILLKLLGARVGHRRVARGGVAVRLGVRDLGLLRLRGLRGEVGLLAGLRGELRVALVL